MSRPDTSAGQEVPGDYPGLNGLVRRSVASVAARSGAWPWWAQAACVYAAARIVSACIFMAAALHQGVNPWFPAKPDYWNFINIWDARWYGEVLRNGYPSQLPVDEGGNVQENAWAFYALFPMLGRALSAMTGLDPALALTFIAMAAGLGAALVVYCLFRQKAGHRTAMWAVAFFSAFPVAAVLQVPYAESLNLLLLASALLLVMQRRYLWAMPVVVLMCLSRPTGVPFAAMAGGLLAYRVWQRTRSAPDSNGPLPHNGRELLSLAALAAVSGLSALMWPAIAWAVTGDPAAYTKTETVWRGHDLVPFKPWFDTGIQLFGPVLGILAPFRVCGPLRAADDFPAGGGARGRTAALVRLLHGVPAGVPAPPDQHVPDAVAAVSAGAECGPAIAFAGLPRDGGHHVRAAPDRLDRVAVGMGAAARRGRLSAVSRNGPL